MSEYSARALATILGLSERTIRNRLKRGYYLGARKVNATLWAIPDAAIAPEVNIPSLARRIDALESRVTEQEQALKAVKQLVTRYGGQETPLLYRDVQPTYPIPPKPRHDTDIATLGPFRNRTDVARWLDGHGVTFNTARHWPLPLGAEAALRFALGHIAAKGYRTSNIQIRRCARPGCPCLGVLPD